MNIFAIRKHLFQSDHGLLICALLVFFIAGSINNSSRKPTLKLDKQETALNINKDLLNFLSAGNRRLVTDLLWIQTLLESDLEHYRKKDLNSWMYLRFLTISHLDPLFYENYLWGGQYLSIVKDDLLGAIQLFKRGLLYYPNDYRLRFYLGFAYYFELGDFENGVTHLKKIVDHPKAPPYLKIIVTKMKFESEKNFELTLSYLKDLMASTKDRVFKDKLIIDYYAVKAERDITCLNQKNLNCDRFDANGVPYYFFNNKYRSVKKFAPYRLKRKGDYSRAQQVDTI